MRTTIHLLDELYRALKARAGLSLLAFRQLVRDVIERALPHPREERQGEGEGHRVAPPVIIPPRGVPIEAVSRARVRRLEEAEDEAKRVRSARR